MVNIKITGDKKTVKTTTVRDHILTVPKSKKNPTGKTVRDRHIRRLPGTDLNNDEIIDLFKKYDRKGLAYPSSKKLLKEYKNSDDYDELIAVWVDYFNKKLVINPPLEPDLIKALIASESGFRHDPKENKIAFGITQITKQTLKILQDPSGEAKEFIFKNIRQKDLKEPRIAVPIAIRWLYRKQETAKSKLGRAPTHEEIVLDYKGLLKSSTKYKDKALKKYRRHYAELKK
ncbi:MAG: lytic transglycosylase domain-containing protein [Bdellovibrionaceae bacterium]|nr:lytic transglycosylase domain-containing protein [Pseudobdellovibrionaceae bacterium]